jgi:hypothetical protein
MAVEYDRIGQQAGERWKHPFDMSDTEYVALLRRVPDGGGLPAYLAAIAIEDAERLRRAPFKFAVL